MNGGAHAGHASWPRRGLAAGGAFGCAGALALAAVAAHGLAGADARRVGIAAGVLFAHGLALLVLAPLAESRLRLLALAMLAAGTLLFAGSLLAAALAGWPTPLAPVGGWLLMLGWLVVAADALRR